MALVATLNPSPQIAAYCAAMVLGLALDCAACGDLACVPSSAKKSKAQ